MWSELVEMVEIQCQDIQQPRQRQARAMLLLYGSLTNCDEAFTNYKNHRSDINLANAVFSVDALISALQNLDSILSLFEPEIALSLKHYALEENRLAYVSKPKKLLKIQVELLRSAVNAETQAMQLLTDDLSAFTGAKTKLADFIHRTFSLEELLETSPTKKAPSA